MRPVLRAATCQGCPNIPVFLGALRMPSLPRLAESWLEVGMPSQTVWPALWPLSNLDDNNVNQSMVHVDVEGNNSVSGEQSVSLSSDEDKQDVRPFYIPPAPKPLDVGGAGSGSPNPSAWRRGPAWRMKSAAAKLGIAWPEALTESHDEGKRLPKDKSSSRQLLPST